MSKLTSDIQGGRNILVVDDTPANLNLLCGMLKERGYRTRPVPNGTLALEAASVEVPDLILLDISMPEMDGFEVCRRLKMDSRLREIPVIFLTAHTDTEDKVKAFTLGGVDYVTKPFQIEEVHARVATQLQLGQQKRNLQQSYDRLVTLEKLRDELVHMIVHDLRSPLCAIISFLDTLRADSADILSSDSRSDIEHCLSAARKMAAMITSVLDVNKMEAGEMKVSPAQVDMVAMVKKVVTEMRSLAGEREVVFKPAAGSFAIAADPDLVARVVQNLLDNAMKFTSRRGSIRIALESAADFVRFAVADEGPGVSKEYQARIFEKFGQIDAYAANQRHSTGLGLTFCKLAIEAHGGAIGVECNPGNKGSTFWFTLPRSQPPARSDASSGLG